MADSAGSYVSQEMRDRKGVWTEPMYSPEVASSDIRRWAIAVYWPETPPRIFWDAEYARGTRWGGIVAPQDFNPFAWPIDRTLSFRPPAVPVASARPLTGMNGGQTDTYGVPIRPGDVISTRSALVDWEERAGRLGLTLYLYNETRWENQRGETVRTRRSTQIRY